MPSNSDQNSTAPEVRKRGDRDRGGGKLSERDRKPREQERGREKHQDKGAEPRDTSTDPKKPKKPPRKPRPPPGPEPGPQPGPQPSPAPDPSPPPPPPKNSSEYANVPNSTAFSSSLLEEGSSYDSQNYTPALSQQPRQNQKVNEIKEVRISGGKVKALLDYTVQDSFVSEKLGKKLDIQSKRVEGPKYKDPSGKYHSAKKRIKTSVEVEGQKLIDQRLYIVSGDLDSKVVLGTDITSQLKETSSTAATPSQLYSGQLSATSTLPLRTSSWGGYTQDSQLYPESTSNSAFSQNPLAHSIPPQSQPSSSYSTDGPQPQNAVQPEYTHSQALQPSSGPPFMSDYSGRSIGDRYRPVPRTPESGSTEGAGGSYDDSYASDWYNRSTSTPVPFASSYQSPPVLSGEENADEENAQTPPYRGPPYTSSVLQPWKYHQS